MKFLSLRTVYRVFPIIKHSKIFGPRPIPTPGPIDLKKYSVCSSHQGLSICQISSGLVEKWWRNRGSQVAVKKNKKEEKNNKKQNKNRKVFRLCRQTLIIIKKNNKKQNKNRKVFRRCRQTFNKRKLAGKFKLKLSTNVAERGRGLGWNPSFFFFAISAIQTMPTCRNVRVFFISWNWTCRGTLQRGLLPPWIVIWDGFSTEFFVETSRKMDWTRLSLLSRLKNNM